MPGPVHLGPPFHRPGPPPMAPKQPPPQGALGQRSGVAPPSPTPQYPPPPLPPQAGH
jgi:hypothetical protein